ncbi:MAG: hypothetical protein SOY60_04535 [Fusobacterium gastrosuis]|uniref:hypothetical protein n=1 Tax=Fusobacterium TaxID=848 RepID=UPI001F4FE6C2|nr:MULTISPECIES: hypothetical protein [Fusobacterium]MDD7392760.1 hypothetical protein [Fusobacteriaceae bacterium]MCI5724875.1 hypothetical protein [Fusobacterium sp.]MCI7224263.1 hypothetical protein [Fusobacterium sp.]MDD7410662.1 hypothetical protein [Fusobacteriaceae bacterium]MDY4010913.1 hypothetical protein [Fusobacterium gastrosuis]
MAKKFITLKDAEQSICNGKLYVDERAILASSVQDYVRENNIEVVYGEVCSKKIEDSNYNVSNEEKDELSLMIEKILKNDFNVHDENKIKQVVKIMKEVLK